MSTPTIPNQRLTGAWSDAGDPDEYGGTVTPNRSDPPMKSRYPYCYDDVYCGDGSFCNQPEWT
ncbi:MAG: hypothetical protein BWY95_01604 [Bacteroidetes bacterium ADurb.BinA104]|jgi:hypothetical protein|nr:MAG: hypothetical protein BWY95_01604 [Bacteroidetes bacterium ADurb.BinA104]